MSCSSRTWCAAPATSHSVRRRSPPAMPSRCAPTTTPSAPIAATAIPSPAARPWLPPWRNGSDAIVGAHLPIAAGAAWSAQVRKSGQVAVCFFGDGTTNIGAFHEALNLAAVWKLPVIFVCENNLYMEYTPIRSVTAVDRPAADRAQAYGLEPIDIDGNDADTVYRVARESIAKARAGHGPFLIEAKTYRTSGHSRADPAKYRPPGELDAWLERDPIALYRKRLLELGFAETSLRSIENAVQHAVDEATEAAKASPPSPLDVIETDVWADGGSSWRN